ncbi:hypothetical protein L6164_037686 [Bauhinia variegata]|uniref:Uncharacterized protein n=1 Tax=Bauhinia variegata TaxID=167791 RepID=A0ACB9KKX7_BAUVA|nr:hypothetical protein L6164_037686 [Bauhinia variegata]
MISPARLAEMARKWQKMATRKRKRISYTRTRSQRDMQSATAAANKGHFVVYSIDQKRFEIPLKYLSNKVLRELLKWSEEEFGLPSNGPIMLPCDAVLLDYVVSLIQGHVAEEVEKALITSIATCHNNAASSSLDLRPNQQVIIYGF